MENDVPLARGIGIRAGGHDEYWLQDRIASEPACLGLGDLEVVQRERQQSSGGRLDLLLKDPETDTMYETEIMLGDTDESHIIRTIEYWDNERKKWPKRQHIAVIVAEGITHRFYNVIHLLSNALPLIAIKASLLDTNAGHCLHFQKILDTYEEPELEDDASDREPKTEAYWREKSSWTLDTAMSIRDQVAKSIRSVALRFNQDHIVIIINEKPHMWLHKRSNPNSYLRFKLKSQFHDQMDQLLAGHGNFRRLERWYGVKIDKQFAIKCSELLQRMVTLIGESINS